ncbi:DEAD/DEAH box helicase family protein, partial [Paraeggerthella sp.]
MEAVNLRPYQDEARRAIEREWDEGRAKTLLVLPTGCGKTIVFAMVAKDVVDRGGRVLVLAHRGELLDQAA